MSLFKAPDGDSAWLPITYPGHFDPVLHHTGLDPDCHCLVPRTDGDDIVDHTVEVSDGGIDNECWVMIAKLFPLGPFGAQAVVVHHLPEQFLGRWNVA